MIKTSRQLKDLIRNMAKGDSGKSQLLILYILQHAGAEIDTKTLAAALAATCHKRDSEKVFRSIDVF